MPGRKPKPVELKLIEGNRGHRPIPENTPKPTPARPDRPGWLLPYAKREWSRVVPVLEQLGLLTELDRGVLSAYCQAWARFKQAEDVLNKQGFVTVTDKGNVVQRPEVAISRNAVQTMIKCAAEFGMTPSSRGRIQLPDQGDRDEDDLD